MQNKTKKILLSLSITLGLLIIGISYAFFSFVYTGDQANQVKTGTIEFNASSKSYEVTNMFPVEKADASDVATVSISGYTTYEGKIEFVVRANNINDYGSEYGIYPSINLITEEVEGI